MQKKSVKRWLLTIRIFELENKGHACHFSAGGWLSNFCHGFSNS